MITSVKISIALAFIWIGLILGISFIEAWLKFQAPGVTLPIGLGIGKIVFGALNIAEWIIAALILIILVAARELKHFSFYLTAVILLVQTVFILPELNSRADLIIQGNELVESNMHYYYVTLEVFKILVLFYFGMKLFEIVQKENYRRFSIK
ncbi:MAG TPA: hypothetical protein VKY36_01865 [Moheibacter sp.]|nr:hypothetical protein [Moheibacter sp.]